MAAINDITGDAIKSKTPSKDFEDNYDAIDWSTKLEEEDLSDFLLPEKEEDE